MLWAALIIVVSVGGGTVLAFLPRGRATWMGPVRTFALTAALSVVLLHLMPEALEVAGGWAVLVLIAGMFAPEALGKLGASLWRMRRGSDVGREQERHLALEASYFGVLLHRVGDGVGLGAFTGEMQAWSGSGGVVTALAAHAVPVVAIVVLTFDSVRGRGAALTRAVGLALASLVGVFLARGMPGETFVVVGPWIAAFVGGMLLHVVAHDLDEQPPQRTASRLLDLGLGALGFYISLLGTGAHGHEEEGLGPDALVGTFSAVATIVAPYAFVGLAVTALFRNVPAVPLSGATAERRLGRLATHLLGPHLRTTSLLLSVGLLGWKWTALRMLGATSLLLGIAALTRLNVESRALAAEKVLHVKTVPHSFIAKWWEDFDTLGRATVPWLIVALTTATLLDASLLPDASLGRQLLRGAAVIGVFFLARADIPAALVVVWALAEKGMAPGPWTAALLLGPATTRATWRELSVRLGNGGALLSLGFACLCALLCGWVAGVHGMVWWGLGRHSLRTEPEGWQLALAIVFGLIILRQLYQEGIRGFLWNLQMGHHHKGDEHPHRHGHFPP